MSVIVCKRGGSFLLQSISSSLLINRNYSSLLPDSATSIPPSSSVSSSLSLSDNLYNSRRGQILRIPQLVNANGKRTFLVDTLALLRKLEAQGLPTKQAEAITSAINEVLNESFQDTSLLQRETEKLRGDIEKMHNELRGDIEKMHNEFQRENERLRGDNDKIRSELKYEVDKVTAGQRLDLNLERGRTRDELAKQNSETTELNSKLDREIHALRAQLETAKLDLIKYGIGAVLSLSAVGLGIFRLFSH